MVIDHLGIVVRSLSEGVRQWETLFGYKVCSQAMLNSRQKVNVVFLEKSGSVLAKLVEPSDKESPVLGFWRKGGGLHHLCFRCASLNSEVPKLTQQGAQLLVPAQPGEAFNDHHIAFMLAGNNLNVELIDTTEKRGLNCEERR
jgi:methylmalonyl-CoA/ethylmalonyl-CoA epimerase